MPYCREPRHVGRWEAHVSPLKVSQPLKMPWRRCRQIKQTCYNTRVCANTSAVNESYHACDNDDDDDDDDDDGGDDAVFW